MTHWRSRLGGVAVCGVVLLGAITAIAQEPIGTYEQLTVGATAVGITSAITNPSGRTQMNICRIRAEETVRWRADGTNPTAAVGELLGRTDDPVVLPNNAVARRFRVISTSASNAVVTVTCFP